VLRAFTIDRWFVRLAVGLTIGLALALGGLTLSGKSADADAETVPIECGGYDETGELVHAEAAAITSAPLDESGHPVIPPICGGYTEDGVFIGDD
jgi:hypothetical protein